MLRCVSRQLQSEVRLHRSADIRRPRSIDAPPTVIVLMPQNPIRRLLKTLLISSPQQGVQQDVIRLQRRICFEFSAPIAFLVLLREEKLTCRCNCRTHAASEFLNFAEAKLGSRAYRCWC